MVYVLSMSTGMRSSCEVIIKLNMEKAIKGKIFTHTSAEIEYRIVWEMLLKYWKYWDSYQFTFIIESTCLRFAWSISLQVVWSFFDQQTMLSCPQEMLMGLSDHVTLIQHFKDIQVCISLTNQLSDSNYSVVALCMVCTLYDIDPKTCVL